MRERELFLVSIAGAISRGVRRKSAYAQESSLQVIVDALWAVIAVITGFEGMMIMREAWNEKLGFRVWGMFLALVAFTLCAFSIRQVLN